MLSYEATLMLLIHRDEGRCHICGQTESVDDPWEVEHIVPKARGGSDELDNLGLAHQSCNRRKGTDYVESRRSPWRSM